jgi:hypothetical protein
MGARLSALGAIRKVNYLGTQALPNGQPAEVYSIQFANGTTTWMAQSGPDGKLTILWTPG